MLKKNIIADLKLIKERPLLILYLLAPALIALILKLIYPLLKSPLDSLFRLAPENWLTLVLITLISSIPIIIGLLLSYLHTFARSLNRGSVPVKSEFIRNLAEPFLLSVFLFLLCAFITDPVPTEGWLRITVVAVLLSLFAPYLYAVHINRYLQNVNSIFIYWFCGYWILAVPAGLLLSAPWHYLSFLSPLYWISWSWLTTSLYESIFIVALFAILISSNIFLILYGMFRKKSS